MDQKLILASSSVYRRALLEKLQLPFACISPNIDETPLTNEAPNETALRLAKGKAIKVAQSHKSALIIGCDQVAVLDNIELGKPLRHDKAIKQLKLIRGREVYFYTALCLYNAKTKHTQAESVMYLVKFKSLSDAQIDNYLTKEKPYHCAGSAKSEGLGIALIESMTGEDPNALIGLPLIKLINMLENERVNVI